MEKNFLTQMDRERRIEDVLFSQADPLTKVRQIVKCGVDEDDANELVARYETGQMAPVYYERLDLEDEDLY